MKEFLQETGRLAVCILSSILFVALLVLLFIGPTLLAAITNNLWWLLLYIVSIGIAVGVRVWMGE